MDKRSKHLLIFSNTNNLNFVDLNRENAVKAWIVLYHFRNKSLNSILFDMFESYARRNAAGKIKGHGLFHKFQEDLFSLSYLAGAKQTMNAKCNETGWPIELLL